MLSGAPRFHWQARQSEARSRNTPRVFRYSITVSGNFLDAVRVTHLSCEKLDLSGAESWPRVRAARSNFRGTLRGENSLNLYFLGKHSLGVSTPPSSASKLQIFSMRSAQHDSKKTVWKTPEIVA